MFCEIPDFGRCCFCLPLRRGVLTFGYISVCFSAFMIGVYSYYVHNDYLVLMIKGAMTEKATGICIAFYCCELIVNCLMVYGAHMKNTLFLKIFYYYTLTTILASLVLQIIEYSEHGRMFEMLVFNFAVLCIEVYLIFMVRSLIMKLEQGSSHAFDNQLHTIAIGEPTVRVENGVYNNTVTP